MVNKKVFDILRLIRSKNVGIKTFYSLVEIFGGPEKALSNLAKYSQRKKFQHSLTPCSEDEIEWEIKKCREIGAEIITYQDESYPYLLSQTHNPPPILTVLGRKELLNSNTVAIVGARNASANGYNFACRLANELGEAGFTVVSGMARGVDTAAHKGALGTGTVAVIAGGIDNIYPYQNRELYHQMSKTGLIVSEFPFGTVPKGQNFPIRNRIISGLSRGVIIVEAATRSGTLITANRAIDQGREVLVAPGNPYDPRCEGSNRLIKDGATVVTDAEDVINAMKDFKITPKRFLPKSSCVDDSEIEEQKVSVKPGKKSITPPVPKNIKEKILSKINDTLVEIEVLNEQFRLDTKEINILLTELELDGKIVVEFGKVRLV